MYAGTTNLDGMIKVRVEKEYQDTSFTKIVSLLEEAQSITVPEIRIVDRFMHYYIPLALIVAALTALLSRNISNAIAVLVVSCPCGHMLVSSAPMIAAPGGVHQAGHPHQKRQIRGAAHQHHHCDL